ncbi:hypothetical protein [Microbacterium sp. SORGH_AS_0862]|uniref:hypothetical protein n=1 Tax=Microbacterium sp. SORGH_AS_0862 TaxID=3041789 RepID=UPI00278F0CCC|nr:hypothetical protein [Microbacterium sp. SORGH_AS_0862]MDQ1204642.1 hypothetical protein [Microbacterium sp. SORGH_AS_0862]
MTNSTVCQQAVPWYGFNIYKDGALVREQHVQAGTSAIAEVKVYRYLRDGEYPWYAIPRLISQDEHRGCDCGDWS